MKKPVMTREEIDERILNRIPFYSTFYRKKREILEKLKLSIEQKQADVNVESPKEVQKLETIDV
ncbi:MAG: hypothetical protein ACTSP9_08800 [Promethearchaeota archaeon]